MFRNLKLKNTILCELSIVFPSLLAVIAGVLCVILIPNETIASFSLIGCFIIALLFIMPKFVSVFSLDFTLSCLRNWQKDRLSFFTDINGSSRIEIESNISQRILSWGATQSIENNAALNGYKKTKTLSGMDKTVHQTLMVFSMQTLTYEDYINKLDDASKYAQKFINSKKEEAVAVGVIFLADRTEQAVLNKVRQDYIIEEEYIVLPLVYDGASRQYYFDALYEYNMLGKATKNYLLDSIKKVVFGGKLPLENNDRFDYTNEISKWQDKTLGDLIDYIKEENLKDKNFIKDTAQQLSDGQVLFHEEALYIKHNGSLACFITFTDEDTPDKVSIWCVNVWEYPRATEISKKDLKILEQIAADFFKAQNKQVEFDLEE